VQEPSSDCSEVVAFGTVSVSARSARDQADGRICAGECLRSMVAVQASIRAHQGVFWHSCCVRSQAVLRTLAQCSHAFLVLGPIVVVEFVEEGVDSAR